MAFAGRLLTKMRDEGGADKFPLTPVQGTYMIGAASLLGALGVLTFI